jgi:hypothetical protein
MASDKHETHEPRHPDHPPPAPAPSAQDKEATAKAQAELREATQAGSIGAQIILDYNSDAGVAARGGAAGTIEENTAIRDANLLAIGLNPAAPSGPPTGEPYEPPVVQAAAVKHVGPSATKMSSLAAGIQEVPTPPPTEPPARRA